MKKIGYHEITGVIHCLSGLRDRRQRRALADRRH